MSREKLCSCPLEGAFPPVFVGCLTPDLCLPSRTGEDFQRIEFGVDEVMEAEPVGVKDPMYKVSSTLNPQAPEFILGCQASQKAVPTAMPEPDVPDGSDFNSVDCPDSEPSAMDSAQAGQELDGVGGGLGQRERKKKKKRPPGYYNYLEGSGGSNSSSGGGMVVADGPLGSGLVNGHSLGTPSLTSEDMNPEGLSGAELGTPSPTTTPGGSLASAPAPAPTTTTSAPTATEAPAHQRTCASPDESSLDLTSGAPSSSSDGGNNAASSSSSSSSSSQSGAVADGRRTAEQPAERPELLVGGGHSPCPTSPPPPMLAAAAATTEEGEEESVVDNGVANGLAGPSSADGLEDSSEAGEAPQSSPSAATAAPPPPAGAQSPSEQVQASAAPTAPAANPPKSWASLFHNSKPLPGGPQAYVEVKNVPAVTATSPAAAEVPEKAGEVREGPVPVAEDPMAPKLAGNGEKR